MASKILEHIIVSQIMNQLDNQNILNENQHGFRAKRSCENQLLMTTNDITKWMNNIQVGIAILDFAKAFDKVAHERLSEKLQYYGIDRTIRIWIDAFLSKRIQRVVVDGEASMCSYVTSGVPRERYSDLHYSWCSSMTSQTFSIPTPDCLQTTV